MNYLLLKGLKYTFKVTADYDAELKSFSLKNKFIFSQWFGNQINFHKSTTKRFWKWFSFTAILHTLMFIFIEHRIKLKSYYVCNIYIFHLLSCKLKIILDSLFFFSFLFSKSWNSGNNLLIEIIQFYTSKCWTICHWQYGGVRKWTVEENCLKLKMRK